MSRAIDDDLPLKEIQLIITGTDNPYENEEFYPPETDLVEIEIPAAINLNVALFARSANPELNSEEKTTYFGYTPHKSAPNTARELTLHLLPVGQVIIRLAVVEDLAPEDSPDVDAGELHFTRIDSNEIIPIEFSERAVNFQFRTLFLTQSLYAGTYILTGHLRIGDLEVSIPPHNPIVVTHGERVQPETMTISCAEALADADGDGIPCFEDCDDTREQCWLSHHCADSDDDTIPNCEDGSFFDTNIPIPPTCGNGTLDPDETCDHDCPTSLADCPSDQGCASISFTGHPGNCSSQCMETQNPGCVIEGTCVSPDTVDPQNPCKRCQPTISDTGWSPSPGISCTNAACTLFECNTGGSCVSAGEVTCTSGLSCEEEAGGCVCIPNESHCIFNMAGYPNGVKERCDISGTRVVPDYCEVACVPKNDTTALCVDDNPVTELTYFTTETTIILSWSSLFAQTDDFIYRVEKSTDGTSWTTLSDTTDTTYTYTSSAFGEFYFRVRGVESDNPMTPSETVRVPLTEPIPFKVTSTNTPIQEERFPVAEPIEIHFSNDVAPNSVSFNDTHSPCTGTVMLYQEDAGGYCTPLSLVNDSGISNKVVVLPQIALSPNSTYVLKITTGLGDTNGSALANEFRAEFLTQYDPSEIYIYATTTFHQGNLGGREGADTVCQTEQNSTAQSLCAERRAFLSTSSEDTLYRLQSTVGFPLSTPIKSFSNQLIASTWDGLFIEDLQNTLQQAGILRANNQSWWSGSDLLGNEASHCNGWTSSESTALGAAGTGSSNQGEWLQKGIEACDLEYPLLCLCLPY